jgi:hypothetical protein
VLPHHRFIPVAACSRTAYDHANRDVHKRSTAYERYMKKAVCGAPGEWLTPFMLLLR